MTEKRFIISFDNNQNIYDGEEKCYYSSIDAEKLCDLLNELSTESRQLKQRITELELLNDGLNYALKYIRKIDVEIDVGGE